MDVKELITLMRQERVLRVKMGGLEVELSPAAFAPDAPAAAAAPDNAAIQIPAMPANFLLYSVHDQSPLPVMSIKSEEAEP